MQRLLLLLRTATPALARTGIAGRSERSRILLRRRTPFEV